MGEQTKPLQFFLKNILTQKKFYKYIIVGSITAVFDYFSFYAFFVWLKIPWFYASSLTFILAVVFNFILSISFVFEPGIRYGVLKQFKLFFYFCSLAFLINQLSLFIFIEYFHIDTLISKFLSLVLLIIFNYYVRVRKIF